MLAAVVISLGDDLGLHDEDARAKAADERRRPPSSPRRRRQARPDAQGAGRPAADRSRRGDGAPHCQFERRGSEGDERRRQTSPALQAQIERLSQAIDQHRQERADNQGRFEARLASLERSEAAIADRVAPLLPDDKDQLWQQAAARLASEERR